MKTGWKLPVVAGVVLSLIAGAMTAQAGGGGLGRGPGPGRAPGVGVGRQPPAGALGPGGVLGPMAAQLNLTEEQKRVLRSICQESRADSNEVVTAIDNARAALHEAVLGGASEEQIRAAAAALGTAIGNQAVLQAQAVAEAKAVLTPEQLTKFEEFKATVPHVRRQMGGQGFGGGPWGLRMHGPGDSAASGQAIPHSGEIAGGGAPSVPHMSLEQIFQAADADKDGVLTMKELQAFADTTQESRRPRQP